MKYKLLLAYDGTQYGGWQVQPNAISIQATLENALTIVLRTPIAITGAGRTDAGVHALGQVAHFSFLEPLDCFRILGSLNGLLPPDIRVLSLEPVPDEFHARYSAKSKIYHYHLHLDPVMNPFYRLYRHHIHFSLDLELLRSAASLFIGTHDFSAFANEAAEGAAAKNPIRTLSRLDIVPQEGGVRLEFEGESFLYKMVRNITGTLLDVCRGKISLESIPDIFASKDRRKGGTAAPAQGLFLVKIHYGK
ncbi:MAG: tRNA pseudouridine(38-40) synthase TruA [Verrucomicrobia bacterium]|nr:tRNA pseudouridine(38-40) synthase TruA [Verrucomicrobiota bacterium]